MNTRGVASIQGILWMIAATAVFSCTNTLAKLMGENYDIVQVVWARYAFHLAVTGAMIIAGNGLYISKRERLKSTSPV